jgi:sec-independent protein translocase protein TatB
MGSMSALLPPLHIQTASIGIPDTLFLMLLALVVFGPRRLPEIGRQIGKLMYEFRKVSNDFKYQMEEELRASEEADRQKKLQAEAAARAAAAAPEPAPSFESAATPELAVSTTEAAPAQDSAPDAAPAIDGEVRGEPRRFPPDEVRIQPPSTGETVAASRPFRSAAADNPEAQPETAETSIEASSEPSVTAEDSSSAAAEPPAAAPGESSGLEQPAHHA